MNKKHILKSLILVSISTMFFLVSIVTAFLLFWDESTSDVVIGEVVIEVKGYFMKDGVEYEAKNTEYYNNGIILLDISTKEKLNFFDNFRVDILVKSNVDTYFRVIIYEQFTLTTGNTEIAITRDEYSKFKYSDDFFDNREVDEYFYYKNKVKRVNELTPSIINFIIENNDYSHEIYDPKYTIKIGILVEAVQAHRGPYENWGMEKKPWNNENW